MEEQLVPTPVAEFRKDKRITVKTSSGHVFVIRKMSPETMVELTSILELNITPGTPIEQIDVLMKETIEKPEFRPKMIKACNAVVARCVLDPKVGLESTETQLSVDELDPPDLFELFENIIDLSGVSKMAEQFRDKFRKK